MLLPDSLRRGFDAVRRLECLDPFGQFGSTRTLLFVGLMCRAGRKSRLELVAQVGQFSKVSVMRDGLAQAGLVVPKLGFRDGKVLPDTGTF